MWDSGTERDDGIAGRADDTDGALFRLSVSSLPVCPSLALQVPATTRVGRRDRRTSAIPPRLAPDYKTIQAHQLVSPAMWAAGGQTGLILIPVIFISSSSNPPIPLGPPVIPRGRRLGTLPCRELEVREEASREERRVQVWVGGTLCDGVSGSALQVKTVKVNKAICATEAAVRPPLRARGRGEGRRRP